MSTEYLPAMLKHELLGVTLVSLGLAVRAIDQPADGRSRVFEAARRVYGRLRSDCANRVIRTLDRCLVRHSLPPFSEVLNIAVLGDILRINGVHDPPEQMRGEIRPRAALVVSVDSKTGHDIGCRTQCAWL
jgi:hypothetical protein